MPDQDKTSALRDKLIVALDAPDASAARALVTQLGDAVAFYKVGMELCYSGDGLGFAQELIAQGKKVFIDLKLHDIGATVEKATRQIAKMGAQFLTVHGFDQTMRAARRGAEGSTLKLLAVTVMTSYDEADLKAAGYAMGVAELVAHRARQAQAAGIDGLILSPEEVVAMRALVGPNMLLVTPGVRPAGADVGDQKRVMTPARAIAGGADHLVVGRPITQSADPRAAAEAIVREIAQGMESARQRNLP
jgi:orotidine-5'-phosphate decarboxylase